MYLCVRTIRNEIAARWTNCRVIHLVGSKIVSTCLKVSQHLKKVNLQPNAASISFKQIENKRSNQKRQFNQITSERNLWLSYTNFIFIRL